MSQTLVPLPPDHGRIRKFFRRHTNTIISHPVCAWFFALCAACCLGVWLSSGEMFIVIPVLIMGWVFASVAWWWAPSLSKLAKITWIVASAFPLIGEALVLHWHFLPAPVDARQQQPSVAVAASAAIFGLPPEELETLGPAIGSARLSVAAQAEFQKEIVLWNNNLRTFYEINPATQQWRSMPDHWDQSKNWDSQQFLTEKFGRNPPTGGFAKLIFDKKLSADTIGMPMKWDCSYRSDAPIAHQVIGAYLVMGPFHSLKTFNSNGQVFFLNQKTQKYYVRASSKTLASCPASE